MQLYRRPSSSCVASAPRIRLISACANCFARLLFRPAMNRSKSPLLSAVIFLAAITAAQAASDPTVTIEKPKARTTTGGFCRIVSDGTLSGVWGPTSLPTLAFTIRSGSAMADAMHANQGRYNRPGKYPNVIIAVYLGKTALDDTYAGLGTVLLSRGWSHGSFVLNNGSASGHSIADFRQVMIPPALDRRNTCRNTIRISLVIDETFFHSPSLNR